MKPMTSPTDQPVPRRVVLRGAGAMLALPWLEAMGSAATPDERPEATASVPRRMAALFFPNGVREDCWTPEKEGTDWELTRQLQPLE